MAVLGVLRSFLTPGTLATVLAMVYLYMTMTTMHKLLYPLSYIDSGRALNPVHPQWSDDTEVTQWVVLSRKPNDCAKGAKRKRMVLLEQTAIPLKDNTVDTTVNITVDALHENGFRPEDFSNELYITFCIAEAGYVEGSSKNILVTSVPILTTKGVPKFRTTRYLLQDFGLGWVSGVSPYLVEFEEFAQNSLWGGNSYGAQSHYSAEENLRQIKTDIVAKYVSDPTLVIPHPQRHYIPALHPFLQQSGSGKYLPPTFSHAQNVNNEGSIMLVEDIKRMQSGGQIGFRLQVNNADLSRWIFVKQLENTKVTAEKMGMGGDIMDETIEGFAGSSIPVLAAMVVAIVFHTLLDFFAFKSDVNFWKQNTSLRGLSVRALFIDLVFQFITLLYLHNESATPLILIPCVVSLAIQIWKIRKATDFKFSTTYPFYTTERLDNETQKGDKDKVILATMETDKLVMKYISGLVIPIVLAWSVYSLVWEKHPSWWGWVVNSLASFVYSAGFLLMTPQVVINYKLKSVAAMPWNVLTYRFINTFFDDLFAMVITLPSMHKFSVFRDDIVFIVCLYQMFKYRVDTSRKEHDE